MSIVAGPCLTVARPALCLTHWLVALVVFAATSAQLQGAKAGPSECYWGRAYLCALAVGSGVVGWLLISAAVGVWGVSLARGRHWSPPRKVEAAAWAAWAVWWGVVAIAISSSSAPGARRSAGVAVEVFAWALVPLGAASAGVAWVTAMEEDKGGGAPGGDPEAPEDAYM